MNSADHQHHWRKSTFSDAAANCVQIAEAGPDILVRDSKAPEQGHFKFSRQAMAAFVAGVKAGEFDYMA